MQGTQLMSFDAYYDALDAALESHGYINGPDRNQVKDDYDNGLTLRESIQIWLDAWEEEDQEQAVSVYTATNLS